MQFTRRAALTAGFCAFGFSSAPVKQAKAEWYGSVLGALEATEDFWTASTML